MNTDKSMHLCSSLKSVYKLYSYANTSRTVNREAFHAGKKLAIAARKETIKNQVITPVDENV